jgi:hypothetical protein
MRPTMSRGVPHAALLRAGWVGDSRESIHRCMIGNRLRGSGDDTGYWNREVTSS